MLVQVDDKQKRLLHTLSLYWHIFGPPYSVPYCAHNSALCSLILLLKIQIIFWEQTVASIPDVIDGQSEIFADIDRFSFVFQTVFCILVQAIESTKWCGCLVNEHANILPLHSCHDFSRCRK